MRPDRPSTFHTLHSSFEDDGTRPDAMSFGNLLRGRPADPYAIKRRLPGMWMGFLRAHFPTSSHVAVFFDVSERTAEYWWYGGTAPSGPAVALAAQTFPDGFLEMMKEAA